MYITEVRLVGNEKQCGDIFLTITITWRYTIWIHVVDKPLAKFEQPVKASLLNISERCAILFKDIL